MDPELDCRLSWGCWCSRSVLPLREDETEALRRLVRFVWTSATLVGVVGRARRAAAAAAALKELEEPRRAPVKAVRAADAADGFAVEEFSGVCCRGNKSAWGFKAAMMECADHSLVVATLGKQKEDGSQQCQ